MAVPADIPVTVPVVAPTVAVPAALLLQVPPLVAQASVVVAPTHIVVMPVMAAGAGFTVIGFTAVQPPVVNV